MSTGKDQAAGLPETGVEPSGAASTLFWMLPGPTGFADKLAGLLSKHRAVAVHLHERTVFGRHILLERALGHADFGGPAPVHLRIHDASHIDSDIAQHLAEATQRPTISAAALAELNTRGSRQTGGAAVPHTFLLMPRGVKAQRNAWDYLQAFVAALAHSSGDVRLVLVSTDSQPRWERASYEAMLQTGLFDVAEFSGALVPDEMKAYVAMRMVMSSNIAEAPDPAKFPMRRLAHALVAEFAGFDANLAEALLRLRDEDILALPDSLAAVASRLPVPDTVWRETSAKLGTVSQVGGHTLVHTLHEFHLASHKSPYQETAQRELGQRQWRACVGALMPWFEELRHVLIRELRALLESHLAPTGGMKVRRHPVTGRESRIAIDDLECNDIVALTREEQALRGQTSLEVAALDVCSRVTRVRNEIAHLRPPRLHDVHALMESLKAHEAERAVQIRN